MSNRVPIVQGGVVTTGHVGMWSTDGVLQDGGPATNGKLTEIGVTANGGIPLAINSAPPTGAYVQWGVGASASGAVTIYANSFGGAPAAVLNFNINGVLYPFVGQSFNAQFLAWFDELPTTEPTGPGQAYNNGGELAVTAGTSPTDDSFGGQFLTWFYALPTTEPSAGAWNNGGTVAVVQ